MLSYLGSTWGRGEPRFTDEQTVQYSRNLQTNKAVITWDVPVGLDGRISEPFLKQLRAVGSALK